MTEEERKEYYKKYYEANKEKIKATSKRYREQNKEKIKAKERKYREANKEKKKVRERMRYTQTIELQRERKKKYRQENKEKIKATSKRYQEANKELLAAYNVKRKAQKIKATPTWFEQERDKVDLIYVKAREFGFHVDHIVPLRSKKVCGLHTWANLQLLAPEINRAKGNYNWPDMS
jgi:DNA repair exonuclease SbcCD ATPase subunit